MINTYARLDAAGAEIGIVPDSTRDIVVRILSVTGIPFR